MALVQFSTPDLPDNDGFYHIKLASLMRTEGLKPDFPWLPLSILNENEFYGSVKDLTMDLITFLHTFLVEEENKQSKKQPKKRTKK